MQRGAAPKFKELGSSPTIQTTDDEKTLKAIDKETTIGVNREESIEESQLLVLKR